MKYYLVNFMAKCTDAEGNRADAVISTMQTTMREHAMQLGLDNLKWCDEDGTEADYFTIEAVESQQIYSSEEN